MEAFLSFFFLLMLIIAIVMFNKLNKVRIRNKELEKYEKYKEIYYIDVELDKRQAELESLIAKINDLNKEIKQLEDIVSFFKDEEELISFGFYESKYDFGTSEDYKKTIDQIREQQKKLIKEKSAVISKTAWTVGGSYKEGEKVTNDMKKLMLNAFNGECDVSISKVRFNNIIKFEERIKKERDIINNIASRWGCEITEEYLDLKIQELRLVYEYQEKLYEEKEKQRIIRERMKEEEKVRRELEKAKEEAEKEEKRYLEALEETKKLLEKAQGEELEKLNAKILQLQEQLEEAQRQKERAISQAQLTRSGHVYVISNIGSFGENVYKIGMTRRLEPMERVKELGDASVPFGFDVHAMIYSEDAPGLELLLHQEFNKLRMNRVNDRKEFFKVNLEAIEKIVRNKGFEIEFIKTPEAKEYRETVAILMKEESNN